MAALAAGCRKKETAPPGAGESPRVAQLTPPAPRAGREATEAAGATGGAGATPEVTGEDIVPETDEPWLAYADGAVFAIDAEGAREPSEGATILPGTVVTVDPDGQAQIDLPDGSVVDLDEMTELLVQKVEVEGGLRRIELSVLSGAIRVVAAPTSESGSVFRVSTPLGMAEARGTIFSADLGLEADLATVAVFDGAVAVQAGPHTRVVQAPKPDEAGATAGAQTQPPVVVELRPEAPIADVDAPAWLLERWEEWTERQADRLIARYGFDIGAPERVVIRSLDPGAHPFWKTQISLRRTRLLARARVLAGALDPAESAKPANAQARFEAARAAWSARVAAREAFAAMREQRRERWLARREVRVERHATIAGRLAEIRAAHAAWRAAHPVGLHPRVEATAPVRGPKVQVTAPARFREVPHGILRRQGGGVPPPPSSPESAARRRSGGPPPHAVGPRGR